MGSDEIVEGEMKQESLHDEEHCEFFLMFKENQDCG